MSVMHTCVFPARGSGQRRIDTTKNFRLGNVQGRGIVQLDISPLCSLAVAVPLGCGVPELLLGVKGVDFLELLGLVLPQWREFPPLGEELRFPISLVAPCIHALCFPGLLQVLLGCPGLVHLPMLYIPCCEPSASGLPCSSSGLVLYSGSFHTQNSLSP